MQLGPAIIARLEADPTVTALVGDRINWVVRPQGQSGDLPCLVLQEITGTRDQHLKGWQDMREATVQVGCLSLRYSESRALAEAVIACLVPVADVQGTDGAEAVFWRGSTTGPHDLGNQEETRFVHRAVVDLTLRYSILPPPPEFLAVADFKAGTYELNGQPSTLEGLFLDGGSFGSAQIEPGIGWHLSATNGTTNVILQATPELTAILNVSGATVLLEFMTGDPVQDTNIDFYASDDSTDSLQSSDIFMAINEGSYPPYSGMLFEDYAADTYEADYDYFDFGDAEPDMLHRLVATFTDPQLDSSFGGSTAFSMNPTPLGNTPMPGDFWVSLWTRNNTGNADLIAERLVFYPPQPPESLPALSAPDGAARKATTTRRVKGPRPGVERRAGPRPRRS